MALSLACHTRVRAGGGDAKVEATSFSASGRWELGYLRQPRQFQSTTQLKHKALFVSYTQCDIYDFITRRWSRGDFKNPRRHVVAASNSTHAYFAGGEIGRAGEGGYSSDIDIYSLAGDTWAAGRLSQARQVAAAVSVGDAVLFAGGISKDGYSGRVDVFESGKRHKYDLGVARHHISAVANERVAVFAGGFAHSPSAAVDIYNAADKTWAKASLSVARFGMSVAAMGNHMLFAGGIASADSSRLCDRIDIYNTATNTWSTTALSEAKYGMAAVVVEGKAYFIGGYLGNSRLSDKIEIYDIARGTWAYERLQSPRAGMAVAQSHQQIMLAGGHINTAAQCTDRVEVLDITTGKWSVSKITKPRIGIAAAAYNDELLFAGGSIVDKSQIIEPFYGEIEIWKPGNEASQITAFSTNGMHDAMLSYSKEDTTLLVDLTELQYTPVTVRLLDEYMDCKLKNDYLPVGATYEPLKMAALPHGNYWLIIEGSMRPVVRRIQYTESAVQYASN
jgi:Kelch motif.